MNPLVNGYLYLRKYSGLLKYTINYIPIHERASITSYMLWVIKYAINYVPIHEWASIFAKILWVIKQTITYGPTDEWATIFASTLLVIMYSINHQAIRGLGICIHQNTMGH